MKKFSLVLKTILFAFLLCVTNSCVDLDDNLDIPSTRHPLEEVSPNDPKSIGFVESCDGIPESPEILTILAIDTNLPESHDLSPLMPPVRSQGAQGSCVSWATSYYLKSYQEKVQYGYEYSDYSTIMSPAFVFNQTKVSCSLGSCIINALYLLKTKGTTTWQEFPYDPQSCSLLPTEAQISLAATHKISAAYYVESITQPDNTVVPKKDVMKNLIFQGNPVIIAMALDVNFAHAVPMDENNNYIYENYDATRFYGNHAMLIVGYDDELNAFKAVNSWGSAWANSGYCWISYDFFREALDPELKPGLLGTYTAYD